MNNTEIKTVITLALLYAFRMLGLFMILPIFSVYAMHLPHATAILIGLALGIYGFTQACFQIPFGMISDHIGRKPVIIFGLCLFAIGSLVAALSHGIIGILVGRALQGTGAIGSTITALVADNTQEKNRLKAMAMIGITIAISFAVAMIAGPILNNIIGIPGIFALTGLLAIIGILITCIFVPTPKKIVVHPEAEFVPTQFSKIIFNSQLLRLDFGIFTLHAILTAIFIAVPINLFHAGLHSTQQWVLYLPVLLLSFIGMVPFIILAEKKQQMKKVFCGAILAISLSTLLFIPAKPHLLITALLLLVFFTAFTVLEASLPSLVSKFAPAQKKGTALGIYSTSQFFGIFVGGSLGGMIFHHSSSNGLFLATSGLALLWFFVAISMSSPHTLATRKTTYLDEEKTNGKR